MPKIACSKNSNQVEYNRVSEGLFKTILSALCTKMIFCHVLVYTSVSFTLGSSRSWLKYSLHF